MSPEDQEILESAFREVVAEALGHVRQFPRRARLKMRRSISDSGGRIEPAEELVVDFRSDPLRLEGVLKDTTGYQALLELSNEPRFERLLVDAADSVVTSSKDHWLNQFVLSPFVRYYVDLVPSAEWDDDVFAEVFQDVVRHVDGDRPGTRILAPLAAFRSDVERVELGDGFAIVALSDDDASKLYDDFGSTGWGPSAFTMETALEVSHAIEYRGPAEIVGVDHEANRLPDAVTSLRLLRESRVRTLFAWRRSDGRAFGPPFEHLRTSGDSSEGGFDPFGRLTVVEEDVEPIQRMFARLGEVQHADDDGKRRFELAIRRLNLSATRLLVEDRLIDYWVGLETLFAHDGRTEIVFRAKTRVAKFLADDPAERHETASLLARSYDRRSKVVHGDRPRADLATVTTATGDVVRRVLRRRPEGESSVDVEALDFGELPADP